jgi:hypothetical protein
MVEIRGGGTLDGAQLVDAAQDSTLRELITTMQMQGKQAQAAKTDEVAKQVKAADIDALSESYKKQTKQIDTTHDSTKTFQKNLDDVAKSLGTASATLASKGITSLFDFFSTGMDSFRQLSTIGAGFQGNLTELSVTALNAGKSVEGFAKEVAANQNSLIALGGSAEGGARRLAEIGNALNQGQFLQRFSAMGMSLGDITQATQSYLEVQTRQNGLTKQNTNSIAENTLKYSEAIDGVSRALGLNRAELEKNMGKMSMDPVWNVMVNNIKDKDQRDRANMNMTTMMTSAGQEAASAMKEFTLRMPKSDLATAFYQLDQRTQGLIRSVGEGRTSLADAFPTIKTGIDRYLSQFSAQQIAASSMLTAMASYRDSIQNVGQAQKEAMARAQDSLLASRDSFGKVLMELSGTMGTAWNRLIGAIASTDLFRSIESSLKEFADWLGSGNGIAAIKRFAGELATALQEVWTATRQGWTSGGVWGAITAGLSSLWEKVGGVLEREFSKLFQTVFPGAVPNVERTKQEATQVIGELASSGQQQRQSWQQSFSNAISFIQTKAEEFFRGLPAALTSGIDTARSSIGSLFGYVEGWVKNFPEKLAALRAEITGFMEGISLESLSNKITQFTQKLNSDIRSIDLSKFSELSGSIRNLGSFTELEGMFKSLPGTIDKVKQSISGFSDVIKIEIDKLNEMMKPGSVGPEAISNFSRALGQFEAPVMALVNRLSGREGNEAQNITAATISSLIRSVSEFVEKTSASVSSLTNLDPEKIERIMPTLRRVGSEITGIFSSLGALDLAKGAASVGITSSISNLITSLKDIQNVNIDEDKAQKIQVAARTILSGFNGLNLSQGFFSNDAAVSQVVNNIQRFQNINTESLNGVVTSMNQLKGLGSTLGADVVGINTFNDSVSRLAQNLSAAAQASQTLKDNAGSIPSGTGGLAGANNYNPVDPMQMQHLMTDIKTSMYQMVGALNTLVSNSSVRNPSVTTQ